MLTASLITLLGLAIASPMQQPIPGQPEGITVVDCYKVACSADAYVGEWKAKVNRYVYPTMCNDLQYSIAKTVVKLALLERCDEQQPNRLFGPLPSGVPRSTLLIAQDVGLPLQNAMLGSKRKSLGQGGKMFFRMEKMWKRSDGVVVAAVVTHPLVHDFIAAKTANNLAFIVSAQTYWFRKDVFTNEEQIQEFMQLLQKMK